MFKILDIGLSWLDNALLEKFYFLLQATII